MVSVGLPVCVWKEFHGILTFTFFGNLSRRFSDKLVSITPIPSFDWIGLMNRRGHEHLDPTPRHSKHSTKTSRGQLSAFSANLFSSQRPPSRILPASQSRESIAYSQFYFPGWQRDDDHHKTVKERSKQYFVPTQLPGVASKVTK